MSAGVPSPRIASMDQFRGYTVAGMFLVNFIGGFAAIHSVLRHNDTYFSYADSIMPSFMFAVGFSFRLTYLRRRQQSSLAHTVWTYARRSLALVVVSLVMYGFGGHFKHFGEFSEMPAEFEPFREKAPRTNSFEALLTKAKQDDPSKDTRGLLDAASKIGALVKEKEPKKADEKAHYAFAQRVADQALAEGEAYVPSAVNRKAAWDALDTKVKQLVHWRIFFAKLLKSDLWETLAIIGVTQLVVLPFVGWNFFARLAVLIAFGVGHCVLSYWINWDFVYALNDNWMSKLWMTGDSRSWDGGFFGPLSWGVAMMAGTLAYDVVVYSATHKSAAARLIVWGAVFMSIGYAMSCLTRLYELSDKELVAMKDRRIRQDAEKGWLSAVRERQERILKEKRKPLEELQGAIGEQKRSDFLAIYKELAAMPENQERSKHWLADRAEELQEKHPRENARLKELEEQAKKLKEKLMPELDRLEASMTVLQDQERRYPNLDLAESPVLPPWERMKGKSLSELLVEPPFVKPPVDEPRVDEGPHIEHRPRNYWMMGKRMPNLSFITFATGFAFALYGVFVLLCDIGGLRVGVFRTFGTNALAAYFLHHVVGEAVEPLVPHDAPLWYCVGGFGVFFGLTYLLVRYLEKRNIFLKL